MPQEGLVGRRRYCRTLGWHVIVRSYLLLQGFTSAPSQLPNRVGGEALHRTKFLSAEEPPQLAIGRPETTASRATSKDQRAPTLRPCLRATSEHPNFGDPQTTFRSICPSGPLAPCSRFHVGRFTAGAPPGAPCLGLHSRGPGPHPDRVYAGGPNGSILSGRDGGGRNATPGSRALAGLWHGVTGATPGARIDAGTDQATPSPGRAP